MYTPAPAPRAYERVAIYLRKSRQDVELELTGAEDTLARHRRILLDLARRMNLTVIRIYEEVISGDTIEARPQMRQLLADVEDGSYDAVLCHDIDRLGRGGMRDQGQILETFKWSETAIITPEKIYDLSADVDEEALEFKTLSARYEYRQIKKRLARGREASVREGKFTGHTAPYGWERYKLQGQKGWSLRPLEPMASTVRDMARWFLGEEEPRIGTSLIARRLNELGIPGPGGKDWTPCAVRSVLANPVHAGLIRAHSRPEQKNMVDGVLVRSRPRNKTPEIFKGLHDGIISVDQHEKILELLAQNKSRPGPKQVSMKNPLSGLVVCDQCGRAMVRRPYQNGRPDSLLCPYTSCSCVSSDLSEVEDLVLSGLRSWFTDLTLLAPASPSCQSEQSEESDSPSPASPVQSLPLEGKVSPQATDEVAPRPSLSASDVADLETLSRAIAAARADRTRLEAQKARAYDLVEQGVYTPEIFTARMASLADQLAELTGRIEALEADRQRLEQTAAARKNLLPNVRHVLDAYPLAESPKEKNTLLRSVLEKVIYHKTSRARWRPGSDLTVTLVPKF